jgi:AraC-like DNA-binding protein
MGTALSAIHDSVNNPWTVESLAEKRRACLAPHSQRVLKSYSDKHHSNMKPLRMQKAMQLLQQRDKKLVDVARSVGYESDAAFSACNMLAHGLKVPLHSVNAHRDAVDERERLQLFCRHWRKLQGQCFQNDIGPGSETRRT